MRVAVNKLPGVEHTEVSLKQGLAVIRFKPANTTSLDEIRRVIRANGFTPKAAVVKVTGRVMEAGGKLTLAVPGFHESLLLLPDTTAPAKIAELRRSRHDGPVGVEGYIPETERGEKISGIRVRGFSGIE